MEQLSERTIEAIINALNVGMAPEDAFIYAGLTPEELVLATESEHYQAKWRQCSKQLEYSLLDNVRVASLREVAAGRSDSTRWMLERLFTRYSAKQVGTEQTPIHLHMDTVIPQSVMTVVADGTQLRELDTDITTSVGE
jgi:hypothetical protein